MAVQEIVRNLTSHTVKNQAFMPFLLYQAMASLILK